jgi:ABC-2 type transport system permease protein
VTSPGNIYDLGYQGYDGPRLGRPSVAAGLLRETGRAAYGIGRSGRSKIVPFGLAAMALLPAVLAVGIMALAAQAGAGGDILDEASPIQHATYQGLTSALISLFCAAQAPELFGRDQRYGVLPLYFSRIITRYDYALARMGGLFVAVFLVSVVPQVVLSVGAVLAASDPLAAIGDELPEIARYLAQSVLAAALLTVVASVIAAWTPRRAYATAAIIAVFIVPPIIVTVVAQLQAGDAARVLLFASVGDLLEGLNAAIYGTIADSPAVLAADYPGWVYVVATLVGIVGGGAIVIRRYQRVSV